MTGSRSGLIFGTAMLLLCLAYVYYCNPERRAVYRRVGLISLIPAVALLIALVPRLFASRMVDGALISPDDSRYTFFHSGSAGFREESALWLRSRFDAQCADLPRRGGQHRLVP